MTASVSSLMQPAYLNPTERLFGVGSFESLPAVLARFQPRAVLLVLGGSSFRNSRYFSELKEYLAPYRVVEAVPVSQNPTERLIREELKRLRHETFELVLAIGGGSVLDAAKIFAAILGKAEVDLTDYLSRDRAFDDQAVPLVAIPTTAGTGSEVTPYASLETEDKKKVTLSGPSLYPAVALIDPGLTFSMPAYVTACTAFDALSQAIESFWSLRATPFSETHALRAIELILPHLKIAFDNPRDETARAAVSHGSSEAGLAIAHTMTTAVHAVSYPLTAHFRIAHGHACALTLSSFVRFNAPVLKERGRALIQRFGVGDYDQMAQAIERLMEQVSLEKSLGKLGVDRDGILLVLRDGFRPDRIKNNPRPVNTEDLKTMLAKLA